MSCFKCPNRYPGCHSTCEDYAKQKEKFEKIRERRAEETKGTQYDIDSANRIARKLNHRKRKNK